MCCSCSSCCCWYWYCCHGSSLFALCWFRLSFVCYYSLSRRNLLNSTFPKSLSIARSVLSGLYFFFVVVFFQFPIPPVSFACIASYCNLSVPYRSDDRRIEPNRTESNQIKSNLIILFLCFMHVICIMAGGFAPP